MVQNMLKERGILPYYKMMDAADVIFAIVDVPIFCFII